MDLSQEKYLCNVQDDGGFTLVDLYLRMADGRLIRPVKLKKGEYVPTEALDPQDILKSRMNGSLSRSIKMGWIIVENPAIPAEADEKKSPSMVYQKRSSSAITEVAAGIISSSQVSNPVSATVASQESSPWPKDAELPLVRLLTDNQSRTDNSMAITETQLPKKDN